MFLIIFIHFAIFHSPEVNGICVMETLHSRMLQGSSSQLLFSNWESWDQLPWESSNHRHGPTLRAQLLPHPPACEQFIITRSHKELNMTEPLTRTHTIWSLYFKLLFSCSVMPESLQPLGLKHNMPPCPSPTLGVCPSSCSLCEPGPPAILSYDTLFFCPQSFPASGTFPMSLLFTSDDQNTGASDSASVLSLNIQGWSPLKLTGLISLLSRDFQESSSAPQIEGIHFLTLFLLYSTALTTVHDHWEDHSLDINFCHQSNVSDFQHTV